MHYILCSRFPLINRIVKGSGTSSRLSYAKLGLKGHTVVIYKNVAWDFKPVDQICLKSRETCEDRLCCNHDTF